MNGVPYSQILDLGRTFARVITNALAYHYIIELLNKKAKLVYNLCSNV
jgi:hypothetical protein